MLPVVLTSGIFVIVFLQTKPRICNFLLDLNVSLSSDIVLPGSPKVYIPEVSFDVVLYPDHTQCMEVMKQQHLPILWSEIHTIWWEERRAQCYFLWIRCWAIHYEENYKVTANLLLARQIDRVAKAWGYQELANASKIFTAEHPINFSRFFRSRPDLMFFNLDLNCVVAAMKEL